VQNFNDITPFLIKTPRSRILVKSMNTFLIFFISKLTTNLLLFSQSFEYTPHWLVFFYKTQYLATYWRFYKTIFFKKYGILSTNLVKSSIYWTIDGLDSQIAPTRVGHGLRQIEFTPLNLRYYTPTSLVSFAFHKKRHNTLILFILSILPHTYLPNQTSFKLDYSFLLMGDNLNLYSFVNCFYFKIKNY